MELQQTKPMFTLNLLECPQNHTLHRAQNQEHFIPLEIDKKNNKSNPDLGPSLPIIHPKGMFWKRPLSKV